MKKRNARAIIVAALCFGFSLCGMASFAQTEGGTDTWKMLDLAETKYESGEFGEALVLCEKARQSHIAQINSEIDTLRKSLSPAEVKEASDDIDAVHKILEKRNDDAALMIIDSVLLNHTTGYFGYSVSKLLAWLEKKVVYPEADFLAGKIYEAEGETGVALSFYEKAWQIHDFLDIPDERFSIAYRMADIACNTGNFGAQEKYLLLVLTEDPLYGKPGAESQTLAAMVRTLANEKTTDKFFSLYRHMNPTSLKACRDLASFYLANNRMDRALPVAALSATIAVTMLSAAVSKQDFMYEYANLPDLMIQAGKYRQIDTWAKDTAIWDSFQLLALSLYRQGLTDQALSLWKVISLYCPDKTTARLARDELAMKGQN